MYLTKSDAQHVKDLVKMIDAILGLYEESPYDQIDCLRAKTCELIDIVDSDIYDTESVEDLRQEQLQNNIYDFLEPIEN